MLAMQIALSVLLYGGALRSTGASVPDVPRYEPTTKAVPIDTVTGWVVDANGWLEKGSFGVKQEQSAVTAADLGAPLVILTDRGSIVYPVTLTSPSGPIMDNVRLIPFAERQVTVTGKVLRRGEERGIVIETAANAPRDEPVKSFPSRETANVLLAARVTDLSFWLGEGDSVAADAKRAQARAEDGEPLVLVSDSGYIYYPIVPTLATGPADIPSLVKYCDQRVWVSGKVIMRGMERGIIIQSVEAPAPEAKSGYSEPTGTNQPTH